MSGVDGTLRLVLVSAVRTAAWSVEQALTRLAFGSHVALRLLQLRSWLSDRLLGMAESDVLSVLALLDRGGVRVWVAGGWGVDAVVGHRTRRHSDLDLVLTTDEAVEVAAGILHDHGYTQRTDESWDTPALPRRVVVRDQAGRSVDLHVVDPHAHPFGPAGKVNDGFGFTSGMLGGQPVPCLTGRTQLALKAHHAPRAKDLRDQRLLLSRLAASPSHG